MHPEKEGKYLLQRLVAMWNYYTDGWKFSVTWFPGFNGWRLMAEHDNPHHDGKKVRVFAPVTREEWEDQYHGVVDEAAEAMYHESFMPACVVGDDGMTPEEHALALEEGGMTR